MGVDNLVCVCMGVFLVRRKYRGGRGRRWRFGEAWRRLVVLLLVLLMMLALCPGSRTARRRRCHGASHHLVRGPRGQKSVARQQAPWRQSGREENELPGMGSRRLSLALFPWGQHAPTAFLLYSRPGSLSAAKKNDLAVASFS